MDSTRTDAPVRVVPVSRLDWLATSWGFGWTRLLDRVDAAVRELQVPLGQLQGHVDRPQLRWGDAAPLSEW